MRLARAILMYLLEKRLLENRCSSISELEGFLRELGWCRGDCVHTYIRWLKRRGFVTVGKRGASVSICTKDDLKTILMAVDSD
uniref:Uncharacterized protein n=1 Tax=Ignisphaera aggregans TaxID=334771 RepID=A0A7C4BCT5_9CREN